MSQSRALSALCGFVAQRLAILFLFACVRLGGVSEEVSLLLSLVV